MKEKKQKLNVRLLRRIQKHILEEPRRFFMEGTVATGVPGKQFTWGHFFVKDLASTAPECGTAGCIHGWTAMLSGKTPKQAKRLSFRWSERRLGLARNNCEGLFLVSEWPRRFASRYESTKTPATRAKIAAARIEHLIKTGE